MRFVEIVSSLAVAQDHCFGQPPGSQQRGCLVALRVCDALGASESERETVFWTALLRFLGCTGHAYEVAVVFGDDIATRARSFEWDPANPVELARELFAHGAPQHRGMARARVVAALVAGGRTAAEMNFRTGCEVAADLGDRLGLSEDVRVGLAHTFERWNGSGFPGRVKGEAIPVAARVALVCQEFEVLARVHGVADAATIARHRAGRSYDPALVDVVTRIATDTVAYVDKVDPWDEIIALDPQPARRLGANELDRALEVVADFADLKSPFTAGHSRGVSALAAAGAAAAGLGSGDGECVRRAGLIHDIGRCAVSNAIWDKPGALTRDERASVELHALRSEQLWRRSPGLAPLSTIIGHHHERADGRGYHRGVPTVQLPLTTRILAAADRYHALTEHRAHRSALAPTAAASRFAELVAAGHVDPVAADAVLAAASQRTSRRRADLRAGLTSREVDVLTLIARGLTTRQVATRLAITPKTADSHIQHIYTKIGVSTRGAAALYAMRKGLLGPPDG